MGLLKQHRKIDYFKWNPNKRIYEYVASTMAHRNLREASKHLPKQDANGKLIYTVRPEYAPPSINPTTLLGDWRLGYADSDRYYDAATLNLKNKA